MKIKEFCVALLCLGVLGCQKNGLSAQKAQIRENFRKEAPTALAKVPSETIKVKSEIGETTEVRVKGAVILVPKEESRIEKPHGVVLNYSRYIARVVSARGGHEYDTLPSSWGKDDIEKISHIALSSDELIDKATTLQELEDAVVLLTAKAATNPQGADDRVDFVENTSLTGLLCGDFALGRTMCLLVKPRNASGVCYRVDLRAVDKEIPRAAALDFFKSLEIRETAESGVDRELRH